MSDDAEFGLVMPFVVCESAGGPYADQPFVAGYEMGKLDGDLASAAMAGALTIDRTVRTASMPQVDLIAMRRGFLAEVIGHADMEWSTVMFRRVRDGESEPA